MNVLNALNAMKGKGAISNLTTAAAISNPAGAAGAAGTVLLTKTKDYAKRLWETILKIFRVETFKLLVMLLIFMAYLLFALATLLFVNASVNFHKTQATTAGYKKLKDVPTFEYLKANNFMFLDDFILSKNSKLFIAIVSIIGGSIGLLLIHAVAIRYNNSADKDTIRERDRFDAYCNDFLKNKMNFMTIIPYFVFYVIFISAYYTQIASNTCVFDSILDDYKKDNKNIISYKKTDLLAIKDGIQQRIYSDVAVAYKATDFKNYEAALGETKNVVDIDIASIFLIYQTNRRSGGSDGSDPRQYAREYINYLDEYFELLGRKGVADNYQKLYLVGLINDTDAPPDGNIYTLYTKFKEKLDTVKSKIATYYILIITFYTLMCVAIFAISFLLNVSIQKTVIEAVYNIGSKVSKKEISAIIGILAIVIVIVLFIIVAVR
jgi:hypothetical protein